MAGVRMICLAGSSVARSTLTCSCGNAFSACLAKRSNWMAGPASSSSSPTRRPTTDRPRLVAMRTKSPTPNPASRMIAGARNTPASRSACALGRGCTVATVKPLPQATACPLRSRSMTHNSSGSPEILRVLARLLGASEAKRARTPLSAFARARALVRGAAHRHSVGTPGTGTGTLRAQCSRRSSESRTRRAASPTLHPRR